MKIRLFILRPLVTGFFALLFFAAQAQHADYHVQTLDESNGLQLGGINRIIRDHSGFLWLMSSQFIQRYDGVQTKKFALEYDLRDMVIDAGGNIWLTSFQSVYRFADDYRGFIKIKADIKPETQFFSSATGRRDTIFFCASNGIYYWDKTTGTIKKYYIKEIENKQISRDSHLAIYQQYLFFQSGNQLYRYNADTKECLHGYCRDLQIFEPLTADKVMVGTYGFTHTILDFPSGIPTLNTASDFIPEHVTALQHAFGRCVLNDSEFLVGTSRGLMKYNLLQNKFYRQILFNRGIPLPGDTRCLYLYTDDQQTLWIATPSAILYFDPFSSTIGSLHSFTSNSWDNWTRAITEDNDHNIWFATSNGICKWDLRDGHVQSFLPDLSANDRLNFPSVRGLVFDGQNLLIGQTDKGLWIFDPLSGKYKRPVYPPGNAGDSLKTSSEHDFIYGILLLKNGNFFIHARDANYCLHKDYRLEKLSFGSQKIRADKAIVDSSGFIWIYNIDQPGQGLYCVDTNWHVRKFVPVKFMGDNLLMRVHCLLNDSTLLCSYAGVKMVEHIHGNPVIRNIIPELDNKPVRMIFCDRRGLLWVATHNELYRYTPSSGLLEKFDYSDNVLSAGTDLSNTFRASDGTVYLSSFNGLNYFVPERIGRQREALKIHLLNISFGADDSSFFLRDHFSMKYFQNSVVFSFVVPYFKNANKIIYRYRLTGEDRDWVMAGNNTSVRYSSLHPGHYTFSVAASLNGKDWYETKDPFSFSIRPPFWQTWWFRLLAAVLVTAIVFYIVKRRITRIKTKAAIRLQLIQLEAKALRSQMNPHFIFNSLNAISMLVAGRQNEKGVDYLSKFSKLLRFVLDEAENNYIAIRDEINILELYLQLESLRFGDSLHYHISMAPGIDPDIQIPSLLVHPLAENAIWHGLLHKEGERYLTIEFKKEGDELIQCTVEDNGIGLAAARTYKNMRLNGSVRKSKGLQLVQERLKAMQEESHTVTSFTIEDITDAGGDSKGARVTIKFPVLYEL